MIIYCAQNEETFIYLMFNLTITLTLNDVALSLVVGAAVTEWLSSWLAEQEDRGSIPGLAT